ncbi:uncharacterized protein LOC144283780 [Canis aureus]
MPETATTLRFPGSREEAGRDGPPRFGDAPRNGRAVLPPRADSAFPCGAGVIGPRVCVSISGRQRREGGSRVPFVHPRRTSGTVGVRAWLIGLGIIPRLVPQEDSGVGKMKQTPKADVLAQDLKSTSQLTQLPF